MAMIKSCSDCGDPFETDHAWMTRCYKCWLKWKHPDLYKKRFEIAEIKCELCGEIFVGEGWKTFCPGCYIKNIENGKREDLEEREQFK